MLMPMKCNSVGEAAAVFLSLIICMRDRVPSLLWFWSDTTWLCVAPGVSEKVSSGWDTPYRHHKLLYSIHFLPLMLATPNHIPEPAQSASFQRQEATDLPWAPSECPHLLVLVLWDLVLSVTIQSSWPLEGWNVDGPVNRDAGDVR